MNLISKSVITILLIVVIVLTAIILRTPEKSSSRKAETSNPVSQIRRIERLSDFEVCMKQLGYEAWGYRWYGGMIDGVLRVGSDDLSPKPLGGQAVLTTARDLASALKQPSESTIVTGTLLVLVGPIPDDRQTSNVPCRVFLEAKFPSGQGASQTSSHLIEYATEGGRIEIIPDGGALRLSAGVVGKWNDHKSLESHPDKLLDSRSFSPDPSSNYNLFELHWIDSEG